MIQARLAQEFGDASKADIDRLLKVRLMMKIVPFFFFKGTHEKRLF